jgi:hypothetical protein
MTKVLVCGGRDFNDEEYAFTALDRLDAELPRPGITGIISGCAPGADTLGLKWSLKWDLPVKMFPAKWREHGSAAGPIRNQQMIDEGKPDIVVAFPGGNGTADMIRRAEAAGITVHRL